MHIRTSFLLDHQVLSLVRLIALIVSLEFGCELLLVFLFIVFFDRFFGFLFCRLIDFSDVEVRRVIKVTHGNYQDKVWVYIVQETGKHNFFVRVNLEVGN